jgi:hypothetical protein
MALVALVGGDKFATIGGVIAILIGPIVYGIIRGGMVRRRKALADCAAGSSSVL